MSRSILAAAAVAALLSSPASASLAARQTASTSSSVAVSSALTTTSSASGAASTTATVPTAVSECHLHGTEVVCMWGTTEYAVKTTAPTATQDLPASFTGCHLHGTETFCEAPDGSDVQIELEGEDHDHESSSTTETASGTGVSCHMHAGVEHCVDANGNTVERTCAKVTRDYNIPLRVGLLFVILATSALGVFAPILLHRWRPARTHKTFLVLKQFGTGVIISTAFVHLYTHASLMFADECLGELEYEATASALVMAGIFLSFLVDYLGKRIVLARQARRSANASSTPSAPSRLSPATVSVLVLEAGIIFHSVLIGITLVVAADSFFLTLFVVILFHQMFEGIALGSRIAALGHCATPEEEAAQQSTEEMAQRVGNNANNGPAAEEQESSAANSMSPAASGSVESLKRNNHAGNFSLARKLALAAPFALITPVGMAIGLGVLQRFDGNNRQTLLAIGSLDAVSAGILVWVGVVEMWAEDWMVEGAEMLSASAVTTLMAGFGLVSGMVIMSVLGKWA